MRIHFLLLALVAVVVLSQHNVDARLHDPALRRMTEHRLLDELLQRRMEALEEMEGEQGSFQDGFDESETEDEQGSFQVGFNEVGCKKKCRPGYRCASDSNGEFCTNRKYDNGQ